MLALVNAPAGRAAPVVLPLLAVALLLSGPVVARYERWRLRLLEPGLEPDRRPVRGAGWRALEAGYGVVCVVALWLIDLAVVALSLLLPAGLTLTSADAGGGVQAAMLAAAALLLPLAAYPVTAWPAPGRPWPGRSSPTVSWSWTSGWSRSPTRGPAWSTPSSWSGAGLSGTCTTAPSSAWSP